MISYNKKNNKGFTILEALVAILILSISVSSMLGVTASSTTSARYSRNEVTANYLLQEAVDSIRNSRDTIAFQKKDEAGYGWDAFLSRYGYPGGKCFSSNGCILKIEDFNPSDKFGADIDICGTSSCSPLMYNPVGGPLLFYNYTGEEPSMFTRKVVMSVNPVNPDEVKIIATVSWSNDSSVNIKTQTLEMNLLNWQK